MLTVYSSRLSYGGPDRLDVTRKGGDPLGLHFAPSWKILTPALEARRGAPKPQRGLFEQPVREVLQDLFAERSWTEFRGLYLDEMRASYQGLQRHAWERLLLRPLAVLVCYCTDAEHCHRAILREVLVKLGAEDGGEVPDNWRPADPAP